MRTDQTKSSSGKISFWYHLPVTFLSSVVEKAVAKEGLNGTHGPNVILVFPSLDEGDEPGGVQVCAVMARGWWQGWWLHVV